MITMNRMRRHPSEIDDGSVKGDGMSGCAMQPLIRVIPPVML